MNYIAELVCRLFGHDYQTAKVEGLVSSGCDETPTQQKLGSLQTTCGWLV